MRFYPKGLFVFGLFVLLAFAIKAEGIGLLLHLAIVGGGFIGFARLIRQNRDHHRPQPPFSA